MKKLMTFLIVMTISGLSFAGNCKKGNAVSIQDAAAASPELFSSLVAAVSKAGLLGFLDGNRQFTVFAPTNEAFDDDASKIVTKDNNATAMDFLAALSDEEVAEILKYHLTQEERDSADVLGSTQVRMLNMEFTTPILEDETAFINGAEIIVQHQFAYNGVIHVFDSVLLPETITF